MKKAFTKKQLSSKFSSKSNITIRNILVNNTEVNIFYIDCLIDKKLLNSSIIEPLKNSKSASEKDILDALNSTELTQITNLEDATSEILNGAAVIFAEKSSAMFASNIAGYQTRSITEPPTSQVTKGPREGFVEDITINLSLLRRKLKSPNLCVEEMSVGKITQTKIALVYLENVAEQKLVTKLVNQLKDINIDGIIDSYYIESLLEEGKIKFLRRVGNSEKPDVIASRVLEGRIAIVVDGSPIVLTVPFLLMEDLQSPEDYYSIPARATFLRVIRFLGLIIGFLLPGIYVALQSYHYRVLPLNFLITLLSSIQGISFPPLVEILFVLFLFDILSEASARMPKLLGMALSIIGALVLGETTVQAGIISPPSIVVVAISSIMIFIIPDQVPQVSILRAIFTVLGGIAGFYGMLMCFIALTTYLVSINGYGVPYLAPFAPSIKSDHKDALIKKPLTDLTKRPLSLVRKNIIRYRPSAADKTQAKAENQNKKSEVKNG